jgi:hypothetical protein
LSTYTERERGQIWSRMVSLGFRDGSQYERRSDTTTSLVGVRAGGVRVGGIRVSGLLGTLAVGQWAVGWQTWRLGGLATGHLGSGLGFSSVFQKPEWA